MQYQEKLIKTKYIHGIYIKYVSWIPIYEDAFYVIQKTSEIDINFLQEILLQNIQKQVR